MHIGIGIGLDKIRRAIAAIFSPSSLFANSEVGAWYDPSDVNVNWRRNLFTYTEEFDNAAWPKLQATVTANATTAPDGTTTADKINVTTGNLFGGVRPLFNSGVGSTIFSVFAKAGEHTSLELSYYFGATRPYAIFDLTSGIVTSSANLGGGAATITSQGNGWYKCVLYVIGFEGNQYRNIYSLGTGDDTSGIYIWGAQLELGDTATAYQRIVTPEITYVADVQPQPILYQDSAGTIPVTAVEQPVGLMLDKSQGLVLGPELVTNGTFDTDLTGWTNSGSWGWSGGAAVTTGTFGTLTQLVGGRANFKKVVIDYVKTNKRLQLQLIDSTAVNSTVTFGGAVDLSTLGTSPITGYIPSGYDTIRFTTTDGDADWAVNSISVKELPGNHAYQTTSASRPTLKAKYNLLTYTEQFDNAAWVKTGLNTPTSFGEYSKLTENTSTGEHRLYQSTGTGNGVLCDTYFRLKAAERSIIVIGSGGGLPQQVKFNLSTGEVIGTPTVAYTTELQDDGSWIFVIEDRLQSTSSGPVVRICDDSGNISYTGDGTSGIYMWGVDMRAANDGVDLPVYQRVAAATDYDTVGFPTYLKFDGVDDGMVTNSIDFTGTDKMTVWSGLRKLSDAAIGMTYELSLSVNSYNGTFNSVASYSGSGVTAGAYWYCLSKGTTSSFAVSSADYPAPLTGVQTQISDISGDVSTLRVNQVQLASNTGDQGTGNYGNYPLYIGSRSGTLYRFNGRLYSLIVRGAESTATEITDTEDWVNNVTKAY